MRFILIFSLLFISTGVFSQSKTKSIALDRKMDSLNAIVSAKYARQIAKLDSAYNAAYIRELERSNEIANGNNTYYSVLFGALAVVVTFLALFIIVNYYNGKREFERSLEDQKNEHDRVLNENAKAYKAQRDEFAKYLKSNEDAFAVHNERLDQLHANNKKIVDELVKSTKRDFAEFKKSNKADESVVKKMQEKIDQMEKFVEPIPEGKPVLASNYPTGLLGYYGKRTVRCRSCNAPFLVEKYVTSIAATNSYWCPTCGELNAGV